MRRQHGNWEGCAGSRTQQAQALCYGKVWSVWRLQDQWDWPCQGERLSDATYAGTWTLWAKARKPLGTFKKMNNQPQCQIGCWVENGLQEVRSELGTPLAEQPSGPFKRHWSLGLKRWQQQSRQVDGFETHFGDEPNPSWWIRNKKQGCVRSLACKFWGISKTFWWGCQVE